MSNQPLSTPIETPTLDIEPGLPHPTFTFTREDLQRAGKRHETIEGAIVREVTKKFLEWLRDEIAKAYQDEHPGEAIPNDAGLAQWGTDEGFRASILSMSPTELTEQAMHTRRFILFRKSERWAGLELNLESITLTAAETAIVKAK